MVIDWIQLSTLTEDDLVNAVLEATDAAMEGHLSSHEAEDAAMEALPEPFRVMWLINWLDYEVAQNSLLGYFFNSHGRHARQAAEVLDRIGATRMAGVLRSATAVHESALPEWEQRHREIDSMGEYAVVRPFAGLSNAAEFVQLAEAFSTAAGQDKWGDKLAAYLSAEVQRLANAPS